VPTVDTLRVLDALRLHFATVVIDDDQVEAGGLEEGCELAYPRKSRSVFCAGDDVVRYAGAQRELALAQVGHRTRCSNVSIRREFAHRSSVTYRRTPRVTVGGPGTDRNRLVDRSHITSLAALLCCDRATELSCSYRATELSCSYRATELSCSYRATELSCCSIATEQSTAGRAQWRPRVWVGGRADGCGTASLWRLVHAEVGAGEVDLGFGLANAFVDDERAVSGVETVD
jgi:hypothetical protein